MVITIGAIIVTVMMRTMANKAAAAVQTYKLEFS